MAAAGGWLLVVLRRYEAMFALVGAIVLLVIVAGGGFVNPSAATRGAAPFEEVAPFEEPPPGVVAPLPPPDSGPLAPLPLPPFAGGGTPIEPAAPDGDGTTPPARPRPIPTPYADGGRFGQLFAFVSVPGPGQPSGLAVGSAGDVWVASDTPATGQPTRLHHFGADGAALGSVTVAAAPAGITALTMAPSGLLYGASRSPAVILSVRPATATVTTYATIPDVTPCVPQLVTSGCDGSLADAKPLPSALAFDAGGNLFVADSGQGAIWRVAPGGEVQQWVVDSAWVSPIRTSGPTGLAFDGVGNLVIAVASLLSEDVGVVYVQQVKADGAPGTRTELGRTGPGTQPAALALGMSGRVYVSLAGSGRVLVLDAKGDHVGLTPAANIPALPRPAELAFRGTSLLVAAQAPDAAPGGRVVRLPVGELGGRRQ